MIGTSAHACHIHGTGLLTFESVFSLADGLTSLETPDALPSLNKTVTEAVTGRDVLKSVSSPGRTSHSHPDIELGFLTNHSFASLL